MAEKEDLEFEINSSGRSKIGLPEMIIVLMASLTSEFIEWVGDAVNVLPVLGQAIWFLTYVPGLFVSAAIFLWSLMRGMYNDRRKTIKLILMIGGPVADVLTGGLFPETLTLLAAIILHNYGEAKHINMLASKLARKK